MTIFRSKPKPLAFRITNSGTKSLHVMTELWCEEFELKPGDVLEGKASVKELVDTLDPLNFEVYVEDDHVSLWCPYETEFKLEKANSK